MQNRRWLFTSLGVLIFAGVVYFCWRSTQYPQVVGRYEINSPEWSRSILDDYVDDVENFEIGPYYKEIDDSGEYESGVVNWFTVRAPKEYLGDNFEQLFSEMEERITKNSAYELYIVRTPEVPMDRVMMNLAKGPKDFFDPPENDEIYVAFRASPGGVLFFNKKSGHGFFMNQIDY